MTQLKKYGSFLLLLLIAACTEKIDVQLDETYTRLVVNGKITTDSTQQEITLPKLRLLL